MRIILARHGETAWNVEGRYQGQTFDIPLSETGRAQAQALAGRLNAQPIHRCVASPLLRARQTAEIALGERDVALTVDPDLMEISHGNWEGRLATEIAVEFAEVQKAWRETPQEVRLPGGESLLDAQQRGWRAFEKACEGLEDEETLLMVSHDGVNRVILCRILGLPLSCVWNFRQASTCMNLLEGPDLNRLAVVRLNDASHIVPLFGEAVHRKL